MDIDVLYAKVVNGKGFKEAVNSVPKLYSPTDGFYDGIDDSDGYGELLDVVANLMKRFNVGRLLKVQKWGTRRKNQITNILRRSLVQDIESGQIQKNRRNDLDVYDDLRKDIGDKSDKFSKYDFARVARTETARMKALAQLFMWQEAGITKVKYKTKNDNRVGEDHKKLNNKTYEIKWLLSSAGEKERIPNRPNCLINWRTQIQTNNGRKAIKYIEVGDKVLTHTGKYKHVTQLHGGFTNTYHTVELDYKHTKLDVTGNHKFLTKRGWVKAEDLTEDDEVCMKAKRCITCDKKFPEQERPCDYCSKSCQSKATSISQWVKQRENEEVVNKIRSNMSKVSNQAHKDGKCFSKGWKHTDETKNKISNHPSYKTKEHKQKMTILAKKRYELHPETHPNVILAGRHPTHYETKLYNKVKLIIPTAVQQGVVKTYKKDGTYKSTRFPDILIDDLMCVVEYDGTHWHQNKKKEQFRDKDLNRAGYKVLHYRDYVPTQDEIISHLLFLQENKHMNLYVGAKW